ncbi:mannose-6-phosphate isomerase [Listeria booriae]|uniref:class I mannose-6-phosphate isomerase n=1 Tax=Listeria booriae TaxID=1552123 RepID=UPI00162942C3|nr:class I mannose-6-phosphate isomerase [Listeria booriae]MBC1531099.1 mannose-6-phosphate isomerase [Listeria booriae]
MKTRQVTYDHFPTTVVRGDYSVWTTYQEISNELLKAAGMLAKEKVIIAVELYPGIRINEIKAHLIEEIPQAHVFFANEYALYGKEIREKFSMLITDDRVFGRMAALTVEDYYDKEKLEALRTDVAEVKEGIVLVYGTGASLAAQADITVYVDVARWEIQQRMRSREQGNWNDANVDEDILRKYKRGFFLDWRAADRLKVDLFDTIDYYIDSNGEDAPRMITWRDYCTGMEQLLSGPFRLVPYFDSGVWGGQWMKEQLGLDKNKENFAWAFDGVAEENSLYLQFGDVRIETPAINMVLKYPRQLLGEEVFSRFGAELPIRFDFLDTMEGQNLSLQVHPDKEYIKKHFGMDYTQEESYYLLDAKEDALVYLGVKDDADKEALFNDLYEAQDGVTPFDADKYIATFNAKKHDHFLIPSGTIHCSGANAMVLEVSLCAYIFTFKLWDWGRLGMDGTPRPVYIDHGKKVMNWNRSEAWVKENLVNHFTVLVDEPGHKKEQTGLYEYEQIVSERDWFTDYVDYDNSEQTVNMLNLIEGEEVEVISVEGLFEPYTVHFAETFIIPAQIEKFRIRNLNVEQKVGVLRARIR